jgi:hypothetical protein
MITSKWFVPVTFVAIFAVAILGTMGCGSLASQHEAETALTNQGFSRVHLTARHVFFVELRGCGKEDVAKFDFRAVNPAGRSVRVSVCEGWPFKGATIRN